MGSGQISSKSPSLLARGGRHFPRRQRHPSRRQLPSSRLPTLRLWRNTKRQLVMLVATTKTRRVPRSSEDAVAEVDVFVLPLFFIARPRPSTCRARVACTPPSLVEGGSC